MGVNPLSWSDIEAWSRFTRTELEPWELDAICAMDSIAVRWLNMSEADRKKERNKKPATDENLAGAFRALAAPDSKRKQTKRKKSDG